MKTYKIGVIPGDGIGPEVIREGLKVLKALSEQFSFHYELIPYPFGAEHYLKTGEIMPASILSEVRQLDVLYLGAIGDPRIETGKLERGIVGSLRFDLDLFINLRPIELYAEHLCPLKGKRCEDIQFIVVRENTEDVYTNMGGDFKKGAPDEVTIQEMIFTRKGTERAVRFAFELARTRHCHTPKSKVTLCDKANAVQAHDLWRRVFHEVAKEYPDIDIQTGYVDACTMWMIKNPETFDVIVTPNMFGDIITDLGSALVGGLGIAAGANLNPGKVSMFEPIHGSAPKYAGKNVANPLAAINALGLMLDYLGEKEGASYLNRIIRSLLLSQKVPTLNADGRVSTNRVGDMVVAEVLQKSPRLASRP